jgi:RNA polymerase sigma-70 factor (ECF subfamily)
LPRIVVSSEDDEPVGGEHSFRGQIEELFRTQHARLLRVLVRLSGEAELAADLTQEAFVSLMRRGSMPDAPEAWLITGRAQSPAERAGQGESPWAAPAARHGAIGGRSHPTIGEATGARSARRQVRAALERLPERDAQLLVLRSEGYSYRDIATTLGIHEASLGTLLARARRAFVAAYEEPHAPR